MTTLTQDSLALLALTNRFDASEVPPLRASEVWRLLDRVPEPSSLFGLEARAIAELTAGSSVEAERIGRLLDTGVGLAVRLDRLLESGVVPLTVLDDRYPHRLHERLQGATPPVLYCAGELSLLGVDGIGVVGSRDVGPEAVEVARSVAAAVTSARLPLVSGGAKGVDKISMAAAYEAGGQSVGVLADSLEQAIGRSDNRRAMLEGSACLCTPYSPSARFTAGNAMGRNKIIYGLSRVTVVVTSAHGEGGTWAGATEAIKKRYGRVAVWVGPGAGPGNAPLVRAGAAPVDCPDAVLDLEPISADDVAADQMELTFDRQQSIEPSLTRSAASEAEPAPEHEHLSESEEPLAQAAVPPAAGALLPKPTGTCWCGCGKRVDGDAFFLSRHAAGAAQRAVRKHFGSEEAFLLMLGEAPEGGGEQPSQAEPMA